MSCPKCDASGDLNFQCGSYYTFGGLSQSKACIAATSATKSVNEKINKMVNLDLLNAEVVYKWSLDNDISSASRGIIRSHYSDMVKKYIGDNILSEVKIQKKKLSDRIGLLAYKRQPHHAIDDGDSREERTGKEIKRLFDKYSAMSDEELEQNISDWKYQNMCEGVKYEDDLYSQCCEYVLLDRKYKDIM